MSHSDALPNPSPALTDSDALEAIHVVRRSLIESGLGAVVAVTDAHGELLGLLRVGAATLSCVRIASNKAYTSSREKTPSSALGEAARAGGYELAYYGDPRYVGWGGGIPVWRGGSVVGAIGVSGLEEAQDVTLAELAARSIGDADPAAAMTKRDSIG
jgi:glc operon protein GlcG